jgi:hypothetical protein
MPGLLSGRINVALEMVRVLRLTENDRYASGTIVRRRGRQVVRQRSAKPLSAVRSRPAPPKIQSMKAKAKRPHPLQWILEPLETEPSFFQKHMFGCQAAYLHGRLALLLAAHEEPWNGLLVCTSHEFQASLIRDYPALQPHPVLPKWLYLAQASDGFEETAEQLAQQARRNDPRIGVEPAASKRKRRK